MSAIIGHALNSLQLMELRRATTPTTRRRRPLLKGLGWALVAAIAEPFTFQLLRHVGAIYGWVAFLRGGQSWGRQTRTALEHRAS